MKNIIPKLIKLVLAILFMQNIGVWDFVKRMHESSAENPTPQQQFAIERFTDERIKMAERQVSRHEIYSPDEYFEDLLAIEAYGKSIGLKGRWFNSRVTSLQAVVMGEESEGKVTNYEISRAAAKYKDALTDSRRNYDGSINFSWSSIFNSIMSLYLQNIIFGAALMLIWFYQGKKNLVIRNPLSFLLAVIFYPIVIGISWYQGLKAYGRVTYGEAIARRFKDQVFDLLAEDEISAIQEFAKGAVSRSYLEFRFSQGGVSKRSLAQALLVTMILVIIPQQFLKGQSSDPKPLKAQTEISCKIVSDDKATDNDDGCRAIEIVITSLSEPLALLSFIPEDVIKKVRKIVKRIEHIPLAISPI